MYLYIILCLKVISTILQIERMEPFKEWMIQSKSDVGFTSNGSRELPWKLQNRMVTAKHFTFGWRASCTLMGYYHHSIIHQFIFHYPTNSYQSGQTIWGARGNDIGHVLVDTRSIQDRYKVNTRPVNTWPMYQPSVGRYLSWLLALTEITYWQ